jgi:[ribosomal protein S5]-alanine N-acetyltransferase
MLPANLNTERLLLRAPVPEDAAQIFDSYARLPEVSRYMMWRPHSELATVEVFIGECVAAFQSGARLPYILALIGEPQTPIGMLEARPLGHTVELGYVLAPSFWGRGLMPEAITALTNEALAEPSCFRVQAFCDVENVNSQRALEKAAFVREGRHERFSVHPNLSAAPRPCFMYAKCR